MSNETSEAVSLGRKPSDRPDPERDVILLACKALRLLGDAGKAPEAGAIAGKMWWAVKDEDPEGGERLNRVMHYLARVEAKAGAPEHSATATDEEPELHAQRLDPSIRHAQIAAIFESLRPGKAFVLVNSHDPKPLRYQFEAQYPGQFSWDYLETGPEEWKIRIGRPGEPSATGGASTDEPELDAQALPPATRHEQIAQTFEDLASGTAFILVNSHDPKPLRYQFEAEYPGEFTWDYLESGPEVWKVRIARVAV